MHLVDITMFYAAEGGGVSTYLNAKAAWLAQRSRVRHTILSTNVDSGAGTPALLRIPAIAVPGMHGYRVPLSVGASARLMRGLRPDLIEAGDAGHAAWAALRVRRQLGVPAVAFYHSDLAGLVHKRFGQGARRAAGAYLRQLYRQFDLVLAPSRLMVGQLAAIGVRDALHQPLGVDVTTFAPQRRSAAAGRCGASSAWRPKRACWSTPAASPPKRNWRCWSMPCAGWGRATTCCWSAAAASCRAAPSSAWSPSSATSAGWRASWPAATCWCIRATAKPSA